jgi:hypothetical protein
VVVEVVSGGLCGIVKMGTFPENLIFNMDETDFTVSGCHPLCLCLVQALGKCVRIHSH